MGKKVRDLAGQKFGRLAVISLHKVLNKRALWLCLCDCGTSKIVQGGSLTHGCTRSCGCMKGERLAEMSRTHGMGGRHGGKDRPPEYVSWLAMKDRCERPGHHSYHNYGGRGIRICESWRKSFAAFYADMGPRPLGMSLDRINNDGNYEPGNCRWSTTSEQRLNQRGSSMRASA